MTLVESRSWLGQYWDAWNRPLIVGLLKGFAAQTIPPIMSCNPLPSSGYEVLPPCPRRLLLGPGSKIHLGNPGYYLGGFPSAASRPRMAARTARSIPVTRDDGGE